MSIKEHMESITWIDVETGGLDENTHSLLDVYLCQFRVSKNNELILDRELSLPVKSGVYNITSGAMKVNGIDLSDDSDRVGEVKASYLLNKFLGGNGKVLLGGHNTQFDARFFFKYLEFLRVSPIARGLSHIKFNYKFIDTFTLANAIGSTTVAFDFGNFGLHELVRELDLPGYVKDMYQSGAHSAKVDAIASAECYFRLLLDMTYV